MIHKLTTNTNNEADILTRQLVTEDSSNDIEANFQDLGYNADIRFRPLLYDI